MSTQTPQRRLDPFALPAETAIRFPLLLLAGIMLAAITAFAVTQILWPGFTPPTTLEEMAQTTDQHVLAKSLLTALGFFALPAAILLAGVILYLTHPARLRRQKKSVRLQPGSAPDLEAELHLLARQAGMSSPPLIELSPGLSTDGQAYGLPKAYILRLGGGMRLLMRKASQVFGAIVLHELAHIHNQDIWRAYSAEGVWIAALWLSFVPFLLATSYGLIWGQVGRPLLGLADFSASTFWASGWRFLLPGLQIAACLALMRIIRAGLLRAREVYADWRAATWGAEPGRSCSRWRSP
jgi:Zn-dependent protease with chaperone function